MTHVEGIGANENIEVSRKPRRTAKRNRVPAHNQELNLIRGQ
jgi:hypothetical protein